MTAAIVGVIANLSLWFALHVLFTRVAPLNLGPLAVSAPDLTSFDWRAALLGAASAFFIFRRKWNVIRVLALSAAGGLILGQIA
ncbi:hypothetical protein NVSP9465_01100 [Novosphingobium sp. CECT 9465]|nr:hypothetical protein NVSP9465_01100 [Novosphingobium sp. CECT 9465]